MRHTATLAAFILAAFALPAFAQEAAPPAPSLKGKFLVADPGMPDARFAGTVIFMIAHSADGAVGVVVNRPGARRLLGDVMRAFGLAPPAGPAEIKEVELNWGGPVQGDHVLLLHSDEYKTPSTVAVAPGVALSVPKEAFDDIAAGRGPQRLMIVVGYAGWAPGQLEGELQAKGWAVIGAGADLIFDADAAGKWERAWKLRTQEL